MSYLKVTKNNTNYRFSLMPANDTTSKLFPAVKTVKVSTSDTLSFGSISYVSGRKYYVTVKFRTRGDGNSTSSKCSSVGFIASRSDWNNSYSYIHNSATAYAERGQIVEWTYEFTATANEDRYTALYFIIGNYWGNGYDYQTIDLFYYKMWDEQGNVYAEKGKFEGQMPMFLKIINNNEIYYSKLHVRSTQLKIKKINYSPYFLSQSTTEYKYSELASYTNGTLSDKFEY